MPGFDEFEDVQKPDSLDDYNPYRDFGGDDKAEAPRSSETGNTYAPGSAVPRQRGMGCVGWLLILSGVGLVLLIAAAFGIYYAIFNSSLPLAAIERLLESTGEVRVTGLRGTINSGFHADRFEFRSGDDWSHFADVDFEFNGITDLTQNNKLIIDRFTVGSGTIYINKSVGEDSDPDPGGEKFPEDRAAAVTTDGAMLAEIRIDLIELTNLEIIDEKTGVSFRIDKIHLDGFRMEGKEFVSLGDVIVESDHLDFEMLPTTEFADNDSAKVRRKFSGIVRQSMHEKIKADIDFEVDFCLGETGQPDRFDVKLFSGQLQIRNEDGQNTRYEFNDFSYSHFLEADEILVAKSVNGSIVSTADDANPDRQHVTFSEDFSVTLGTTPFTVVTREFELHARKDAFPPVEFRSARPDLDCTLRLRLLDDPPWLKYSLRSESILGDLELAARVWFEKTADELTADERAYLEQHVLVRQDIKGDADSSDVSTNDSKTSEPQENTSSDPGTQPKSQSDPDSETEPGADATSPEAEACCSLSSVNELTYCLC